MRSSRTLSSLIIVNVLVVLVVTGVLGFTFYARTVQDVLFADNEHQALAIAQSVAVDEDIRVAITGGDPNGVVARAADEARQATGAAYVVVIDRRGVRHSHPNPTLVGQTIEEPLDTLDGQPRVGTDPGSLGESANGKAPIRGADGSVVGEVSVGILGRDVTAQLWTVIPTLLGWSLLAVIVGVLSSLLLARRLKRQTFGLELDDLARLLQEREAMLHGIREGVVGLDRRSRLAVLNDEARRLLALEDAVIGQPLDQTMPPGRLRDLLEGTIAGEDQRVLTDEHLLVINRATVAVAGSEIGAVATVRDRTEMEALVRELDSMHGLSDALRAQQHEFSNRLHAMSVLVGMGDQDAALEYLDEISTHATEQAEDLRSRVGPAALAALLLAKITVAAERDVELLVHPDAHLDPAGLDDRTLLTVVGNLVDNALDAVTETGTSGIVTVRLGHRDDGSGQAVEIEVTDSGPGVAPDLVERVFHDGFTTKMPRGELPRGLGLALVHRLVGRAGGWIRAEPGPGGHFRVHLPVRQAAELPALS